MKLLLHRISIVVALTLMFGIAMRADKNVVLHSFIPDAVSAATDGSECTDPSWIGCSVGWLEKGYVYDKAKGYYVKPSGNTTSTQRTTTTTQITTQTSKPAVIATSKPASTTKPNSTNTTNQTTATVKSELPKDNKDNVLESSSTGLSTTVSYTKRSRPERTTGSSQQKSKKSNDFNISLSDVSMDGIVKGLVLLLILVAEFFIVRAIYKKD